MRLKSVFISNYKNLKDFSINFDNDSFIEVFVGKNGAGKSNFFEALIKIFQHLYEDDNNKTQIGFNYCLKFEIKNKDIEIAWAEKQFTINGNKRKTIGSTPLPDNVLIYYSGHNDTVAKLVRKHEDAFRNRIKKADFNESRRFIGIGSEYKELLLAVMLMQKHDNKARRFISQKLGIKIVAPEVMLVLQRPAFADKKLKIDHFELKTHYWGAEGITREFLDKLVTCIKGEFNHGNIYDPKTDNYRISFNIELFQAKFKSETADIFRLFDNLKTLNMLSEISIPLTLENGLDATIAHFSDGQFQSVYIYSIVEIFKDRNCITLLDEPDSFLHPEWQFDFLNQVFDITYAAGKHNHVLMSSHSAVTLIPHDKKKIKFFDIKNNHANCYELEKRIAINKLSSDLIKYSEQEQMLSIINTIQIENKPVLFTEGSTDPIIIKEAWNKLYEEEMPFIPFYAFSSTYINQLLTDHRIHAEMCGLPVFALFDFDKAYDQWKGLNGDIIENDPMKGLIKKWASGESFAFMLPIPLNQDIQKQVIKNKAKKETFCGESCCEIEHLFYGDDSTAKYFQNEPCVGGNKIVFKSDSAKTDFARGAVPALNKIYFEVFRPMFEFIKTKCHTPVLTKSKT
ncbi:MAG: AAA family ATPase [Nitrosomonas sp.]|nr:AAA family ATPase [Nitrosomonas sp.]